jgi:glycosyltransferase involved in cell wall biosynthesis
VITVSQSAKADILRLYRIDPARVHVIHEAAAPEFVPMSDLRALERLRERYRLADRFILYVGTIEPRKNLPRLIEGFAQRRKRGELSHQLVCVGPYGWLSRDIDALVERLRVTDAVRFTGYVPFDDLPALYNLAEMLVFPSIYEGFGLPVIEAMACGTPVITGHVPALDEVGGRAVEQVEHLESSALGDAMVRLANDAPRRDALRVAGLERARTFSWARAARETLGVYAEALGHAPAIAPAGALTQEVR